MPRVRRRVTIHVDAAYDVVAAAAAARARARRAPDRRDRRRAARSPSPSTPDGTGTTSRSTVEDDARHPVLPVVLRARAQRSLTGARCTRPNASRPASPADPLPKPLRRSLFLPPVSFTPSRRASSPRSRWPRRSPASARRCSARTSTRSPRASASPNSDLGVSLAVTRAGVLFVARRHRARRPAGPPDRAALVRRRPLPRQPRLGGLPQHRGVHRRPSSSSGPA